MINQNLSELSIVHNTYMTQKNKEREKEKSNSLLSVFVLVSALLKQTVIISQNKMLHNARLLAALLSISSHTVF